MTSTITTAITITILLSQHAGIFFVLFLLLKIITTVSNVDPNVTEILKYYLYVCPLPPVVTDFLPTNPLAPYVGGCLSVKKPIQMMDLKNINAQLLEMITTYINGILATVG